MVRFVEAPPPDLRRLHLRRPGADPILVVVRLVHGPEVVGLGFGVEPLAVSPHRFTEIAIDTPTRAMAAKIENMIVSASFASDIPAWER